jgi:hypothetical protein
LLKARQDAAYSPNLARASQDQRAEIAGKLLASLDGEVDAEAESEWGAEIERRLARIESGQMKSVSINESLARLHRIARDED